VNWEGRWGGTLCEYNYSKLLAVQGQYRDILHTHNTIIPDASIARDYNSSTPPTTGGEDSCDEHPPTPASILHRQHWCVTSPLYTWIPLCPNLSRLGVEITPC
jgi:hypothetical protein